MRRTAFGDLAHAPFEELVPRFARLLAQLTPDEIAGVLRLLSSSSSGVDRAARSADAPSDSDVEGAGAPPLDDIARAILALPVTGRRLGHVERRVLERALEETKGNVSAAARRLGTDRKVLERRIDRLALSVPRRPTR